MESLKYKERRWGMSMEKSNAGGAEASTASHYIQHTGGGSAQQEAGREADVSNKRLTGSSGRHTRKPGKRAV